MAVPGSIPLRLGRISSVHSLDRLGYRGWGAEGWGHEGRFNRDPLPVFSAGGHCEPFWHVLFDVVHPAFSLPTMASPILQGAMKNGFLEAVVKCEMPEVSVS